MTGTTDDDLGPDDDGPTDETDPRVHDGLDHLQRAARELIAASRAFLDVAEDLVERPDGVQQLLGAVGSLGDAAGRVLRGGAGRTPVRDDDGDDDDPPVQRIPVS